jgi:hypothetical protein
MIREGSSLKTLCLSYNSIGDDGAIAFAEAISRNRVLKKLTMKSNSIGNPGLRALADGLAANQRNGPRGLNYFSLFGNEFSNSNGKQWTDLITSFEFVSDFHHGQEAKWGGGGHISSEEQVGAGTMMTLLSAEGGVLFVVLSLLVSCSCFLLLAFWVSGQTGLQP